MTTPVLYIGNKVYSSWSMRPWLALKHANIDFVESPVHLYDDAAGDVLNALSPVGTVPVLTVGDLVVWDSLAICEWAAEQVPNLWPADATKRAVARAATATMHAGFGAIRSTYHHNIKRAEPLRTAPPQAAVAEVAMMDRMLGALKTTWGQGGDYLFGDWSIADAFYTPMAVRVRAYDLPVSATVRAYFANLLANEDFKLWQADAVREDYAHPPYESV
jgi:glutathione S-transferase